MEELVSNAEMAAQYGMTEEQFNELLGSLEIMEKDENGNWRPTEKTLAEGYAVMGGEEK